MDKLSQEDYGSVVENSCNVGPLVGFSKLILDMGFRGASAQLAQNFSMRDYSHGNGVTTLFLSCRKDIQHLLTERVIGELYEGFMRMGMEIQIRWE